MDFYEDDNSLIVMNSDWCNGRCDDGQQHLKVDCKYACYWRQCKNTDGGYKWWFDYPCACNPSAEHAENSTFQIITKPCEMKCLDCGKLSRVNGVMHTCTLCSVHEKEILHVHKQGMPDCLVVCTSCSFLRKS